MGCAGSQVAGESLYSLINLLFYMFVLGACGVFLNVRPREGPLFLDPRAVLAVSSAL